MRTDEHRNPTAFTTDVAKQAGLKLGIDYEVGKPFPGNPELHTAKLLGDPVTLTVQVIDQIGFYTKRGMGRWSYIAMPDFIWHGLSREKQRDIIGFMYQREGGTAMKSLFPMYGTA